MSFFSKGQLLILISLVFIGSVLFRYVVFSSVTAHNCGVAMLNDFGLAILSDYEQLAEGKYSDKFPHLPRASLSKGMYNFYWVMQTQVGDIEHVVQVRNYNLCPTFYGNIEVIVPQSSSLLFKKYIDSLDNWGG